MDLGKPDPNPFTNFESIEHDGICHSVFKAGSGPGVLLMHELPGMTPEFWRLANWLAKHFTVWTPDLFGNKSTPTKPGNLKHTFRYCISREIHLFSKNDPGPITQWLREVSKQLFDEAGGRGVGVIGMCMTGNFSLTLALNPWVTAPVASQPALPAALNPERTKGGLQMKEDEKAKLAERDVDVMGLRFEGDKLCQAARFDAIRGVIGEDRFKEIVIPDEHRNPNGPLKFAHSVLTADLVQEGNSETKAKLLEVIEFLDARIR